MKKDPVNEEFLSHLFMAYVRLGQLKKQQATAISLYKVTIYWARLTQETQGGTSRPPKGTEPGSD